MQMGEASSSRTPAAAGMLKTACRPAKLGTALRVEAFSVKIWECVYTPTHTLCACPKMLRENSDDAKTSHSFVSLLLH